MAITIDFFEFNFFLLPVWKKEKTAIKSLNPKEIIIPKIGWFGQEKFAIFLLWLNKF